MKARYFLIVFLIHSFCFSQVPNVLSHETFDWKSWEEPISDDEMMVEINIVKQIPRMDSILKTKFWSIDNFHLIDYDQDGKEDLIYQGFTGDECDKVLFLNGSCGSYSIRLEYYGEIISMWRYKDLEPLCFKILDRPGCDGTTAQIESYEPRGMEEEYSYKLVSKEAYVEWTHFPDEFTNSQLFNVDNNYYRLRSAPLIDDEPNFDHFAYCSDGNILAEYPKNSNGIVLYERKINNIVWWFVLMKPNDGVENSIFHHGKNGFDESSYYGWMSSKYLTQLDH